jgi:hypothetical protein
MQDDVRAKLQQLIAALERHLEAAISSQGQQQSENLDSAYFALEEAYLAYEESLDTELGESLPFEIPPDE